MGKLEIIIFGITGFLAYNAYHDNYYLQKIKSYRKYFETAMYLFIGFSFYLMIKKNPSQTKNMLSQASNMVKYLPVDKDAISMVTPFFNLTGDAIPDGRQQYQEQKILQSGGVNSFYPNQNQQTATKRSVSETKKKWVASQQNWKCGLCNVQLQAWFEVDHRIELENGGSNHVNNLIALCRDCHGKKTMMSRL